MDGLEFLHNIGIVHRDIRPSNLILHSSDSGINLVIIDYENDVLVKEVSNGVDYFGGLYLGPSGSLKAMTQTTSLRQKTTSSHPS